MDVPGERKLATVLFADLVGSTELGGSQDPERTRATLERFYDAMAGEIDTAGGTVEKFAGDAVMAVFGAPASLEDHAERDQEGRRLERSAEDLGMQGYSDMFDPVHVEIAIARGDLAGVGRKLGEWSPGGLQDVDGLIARLNALVALDRRSAIEAEAPALVRPNTYLEPFALRALGFARTDRGLIEQAVQQFEAMGLDWHAAESRKLVAQTREAR